MGTQKWRCCKWTRGPLLWERETSCEHSGNSFDVFYLAHPDDQEESDQTQASIGFTADRSRKRVHSPKKGIYFKDNNI